MPYPKPHPAPDPSVWTQGIPLYRLEANTPLFRISPSIYPDPRHFSVDGDPPGRQLVRNRFSDPRWRDIGDPYGVLYLSLDHFACFRETVLSLDTGRYVPKEILPSHSLFEIYCDKPLELVDITGSRLAWLDADARLSCGGDYEVSQRWSLTFWEHNSPKVDGIYYRSRRDPSRFCVALYSDRVLQANLRHQSIVQDLTQFPELDTILQEYGFEQWSPEAESKSINDLKFQ